jgi:hypothetical protein
MVAASDEEIAASDFNLSILPLENALAVALRFATVLAERPRQMGSPN